MPDRCKDGGVANNPFKRCGRSWVHERIVCTMGWSPGDQRAPRPRHRHHGTARRGPEELEAWTGANSESGFFAFRSIWRICPHGRNAMTKRPKAKRTMSKRSAAISPAKPRGRWKLRLTPEMRKIAQNFHESAIKVWAAELGEFEEPPVASLMVRLIFQEPVEGSRASELVKMIQAASVLNIAADTERAVNLYWCLDALEKDALHNQSASAGTPTGLSWSDLQQRIQAAKLRVLNLGAPTYRATDAGIVGGLPDFRAIWGQREQYTTRLAELETEGWALRDESDNLTRTTDDSPQPPCKTACLHIVQSRAEIIVSVGDLLGGPLAGWVSQIGRSVSATVSLNMDPRWRDLTLAYLELHLESGLLDFMPLEIEGGAEAPLWNNARLLLSQAQQLLLQFLKGACEFDAPPALPNQMSQAKEPRAKMEKAKPAASTNEKPARKMVCVQRTGAEGSALKVQVDGVEVGDEAATTKKVLLAACILHLRSRNYDWWETKDLMALVLTAGELTKQMKDRAKDLGNWQGTLLASSHRLSLEKQQGGRRFRLSGIEFQTSLKEPEIMSELQRFSEKHPIQRRAREKRS